MCPHSLAKTLAELNKIKEIFFIWNFIVCLLFRPGIKYGELNVSETAQIKYKSSWSIWVCGNFELILSMSGFVFFS